MLIRVSDMKLMKKYLVPIDNDIYKLKDTTIPKKDLEKLRELDDLQVLCYGSHMIKDWEEEEIAD